MEMVTQNTTNNSCIVFEEVNMIEQRTSTEVPATKFYIKKTGKFDIKKIGNPDLSRKLTDVYGK
jgi:hypothetical protein